MNTNSNTDFFKSNVLGHPAGLFVLFFTEMWERFSFYGMRVLLVMFLVAAVDSSNPGFGMEASQATAVFGTYAMLLYLTPIFGGVLADKLLGYRWAVVIGSVLMTLGHVAMAIETQLWVYIGLGLLVIGTGFFKPNMTSILSEMYKDVPEKKDGAFTIFYMGVNAGAFFGMMLCGYLGEKVGWSYGFGLAGVFMLLGTLQFWLAKPLFGAIGEVPSGKHEVEIAPGINQDDSDSIESIGSEITKEPHSLDSLPDSDKRNPFTVLDTILIVFSSVIGLLYAINDPLSKIAGVDMFAFATIPDVLSGQVVMGLVALFAFLFMVISRILRYDPIVRDRMIAVIIFAFFTVFFWLAFEQGASSLVLFAKDSVDRTLEGDAATIFKVIDSLLTVVPLLIISYVLFLLAKQTWKKIPASNIVLIVTFIGVWYVAYWKLDREFSVENADISVSWFSTLNSFFIIAFASLISKWWESKYNPSAAVKYGLGLIIMAMGFGLLAFGAYGLEAGVKVSMIWLILAYLLHTLGELCLSPVGLSYVSKLVPPRMIAFMFGMWYLAIAIGNKLAAVVGGQIETITKQYDLATFFLIFTFVPAISGVLVIILNPLLKKLMHGVK